MTIDEYNKLRDRMRAKLEDRLSISGMDSHLLASELAMEALEELGIKVST